MFVIEYRTISRLGNIYPSRVMTLGAHKAASVEAAASYVLRTTPNVEVLSVRYEPVGA